MLTGQRAFAGEDVADVLAPVVRAGAGLDAACPLICARPRDAGAARVPAEGPEATPRRDIAAMCASRSTARSRPPRQRRDPQPRRRLRAGGWPGWPRSPSRCWPLPRWLCPRCGICAKHHPLRRPRRASSLPRPTSGAWWNGPPRGGVALPLAVSPDGRRIAFLAAGPDGTSRLWVRALDTLAAQALAGTEGASSPFWSPDSRALGFFAGGKLKKVDVSGGPALTVCDAPNNRGGTWSRDGIIVFNPSGNVALQQVSAAGGTPTPATVLGPGEGGHRRPFFLPDGRHFLYSATIAANEMQIYVGSLDSTERTLLVNADANNVAYSQGHLLFVRETTLMAQPFDLVRLTLTGEPVPISEELQGSNTSPPNRFFSVSDAGVLVYQTGTGGGGERELTWFDRAGKRLGTVDKPGVYNTVSLSPDGTRVAVSLAVEGARAERPVGARVGARHEHAPHVRWRPGLEGRVVAGWEPPGVVVRPR